ncbi:hypothetical protein HMN09_01162600 [Mycena chlorophos]|uniref:Uncharacterized protein n=1 Tax=Mycena chlorophos TaxID=658473 RepID=A0A8H6S7J7_MYCCL|nr:hypothetical protein HMN09_01162600 [Mycena chlorophos]
MFQAASTSSQSQTQSGASPGRKARRKRAKQRNKQHQQAQNSAQRASAQRRKRGGRSRRSQAGPSTYSEPRHSYAEYQDIDEFYDELADRDPGLCGFSESDAWELMCQGVKPWDDDAHDVLAALRDDNFSYY